MRKPKEALENIFDKVEDFVIAKAFAFWVWLGAALDVTLTVQVPRPQPWVIYQDDSEKVALLGEQFHEAQAARLELQDKVTGLEQVNTHLSRRNEELTAELSVGHAENADLRSKLSRVSDTFGSLLNTPAAGPDRVNRKKLTLREVSEVRERARAGEKQVDIARSFDVNPATISRIVRGLYFKAA